MTRSTHVHPLPSGPYDHSARIECGACIELLWQQRDQLCEKYGWSSWPEGLSQGRDWLPPRQETPQVLLVGQARA